jgi:hypothetical protein
MAIWTLIPDKFDEDNAKLARYGVFGTTLAAFFLAEMGDPKLKWLPSLWSLITTPPSTLWQAQQ